MSKLVPTWTQKRCPRCEYRLIRLTYDDGSGDYFMYCVKCKWEG